MSYKVDYDAMQNLLGSYSNAVDAWSAGISSVIQGEMIIEASSNISGNSANRMREYLKTTYLCAKDSLLLLLKLFQQNYLLYTHAYYQQIDPASDTCIDETELSRLRDKLQDKRRQLQQISLAAENASTGIANLVSLPSLDFGAADEQLGRILTSLDELDNAVNGLESAHVSADFTEIDEMISRLEAFFKEMYGLSKEFKTDFTMASFVGLASIPALIAEAHKTQALLDEQESDVIVAVRALENRLEQEQTELKKRQEQAAWAKIGVGVVIGVVAVAVTAALTVATGGAGLVIIGMVSGTVSGAITATFGAAADEYVKNGWNTQDWDVNRITVSGCIGATTGMIGGMIAPGTGTLAKSGIKALSSAIEGAASNSYDQLAASGYITDVGEIIGDAAIKSTSGFAGSLVGSAVSDQVGDFVKRNDMIKDLAEHVVGGKEHFGAVLQVDGASEIASGVAKRFTSTAVKETGGFIGSVAEGKSISEAYNEHSIISESFQEAVDVKSVVGDAASAVSSAATDNPLTDNLKKLDRRTDDYYIFGDSPDLNGKEKAWKDWNSEEYDRMMQKLAEMDERGEDSQSYEVFGDPRSFSAQRSSAVNEAWEQERRLVLQGKGTRDWTVSQQEELIRTGRVSGFDGSHMLDASSNPSVASNPDNIQFLTYEEHIYGAHAGNTHNPTTGRFDTVTGKTNPISPGKIPHRDEVAFELSQKFDYKQADLAEQLGAPFGYDRGTKSK